MPVREETFGQGISKRRRTVLTNPTREEARAHRGGPGPGSIQEYIKQQTLEILRCLRTLGEATDADFGDTFDLNGLRVRLGKKEAYSPAWICGAILDRVHILSIISLIHDYPNKDFHIFSRGVEIGALIQEIQIKAAIEPSWLALRQAKGPPSKKSRNTALATEYLKLKERRSNQSPSALKASIGKTRNDLSRSASIAAINNGLKALKKSSC